MKANEDANDVIFSYVSDMYHTVAASRILFVGSLKNFHKKRIRIYQVIDKKKKKKKKVKFYNFILQVFKF